MNEHYDTAVKLYERATEATDGATANFLLAGAQVQAILALTAVIGETLT